MMAEDARNGTASLDPVRQLIAAAEQEAAAISAILPPPPPPLHAVPGYEIVGELGRGGMGVVYRALQLSTKRVVALKVMLAGCFASTPARIRFQQEVELCARLQHSGIARVLESGLTADGQPYYAMDYVDAVPLDHWLKVSQPDVPTILTAFVEICAAVQHAHQHDVIHRDLKPSNVLVDAEGKPHVMDFGLAKAADHPGAEILAASVSSPGQILGTLGYLSPEQAIGRPEKIDARSDVYTLGAMLYEALTGFPLYDPHAPPSEVLPRIREEPPKRPSLLSDRVDGELETIILKTLEKEKARRYQSARELGEDLGRYLRSEPILAKPPSTLYRLRKKLWRNRLRVGLALAAAALASIGVWGDRWWRNRLFEREHARGLAGARHEALLIQVDIEAGHTEDAVGQIQRLLPRYADLPEVELAWAQARFRRGEETGNLDLQSLASSDLQTRPGDDPLLWAFRALLSEIQRKRGNVREADQLQALAGRDAPRTPEAWYLYSFATMDINKAVRYAEEAVRCEPTHALAWKRLGYLYLQTEDFDRARQAARRLVDLGADGFVWAAFEGDAFVIEGLYDEAVEQYTSVLAAYPNRQGETHNYRALAFLCNKKYEDAVKDYSEALRIAGSTVPFILYRRATPLWILGRLDSAAEDYVAFINLHSSPTYAPARLFLVRQQQAGLFEKEGRASEAEEARKTAQEALVTFRRKAAPGTWTEKVCQCLDRTLTPRALVDAAKTSAEKCEAHYYGGEVYLLKARETPDAVRAREWMDEAQWHFEQCVATGVVLDKHNFPRGQLDPMNEYHLAGWRLDQLAAENVSPP